MRGRYPYVTVRSRRPPVSVTLRITFWVTALLFGVAWAAAVSNAVYVASVGM